MELVVWLAAHLLELAHERRKEVIIVSSDGSATDVRRKPPLSYFIAEKPVQITYSLVKYQFNFILRLYNGVRNNLGLAHSTREIAKTRFHYKGFQNSAWQLNQ